MMDTNLLGKGEDFNKLPETWVIFITEKTSNVYWINEQRSLQQQYCDMDRVKLETDAEEKNGKSL